MSGNDCLNDDQMQRKTYSFGPTGEEHRVDIALPPARRAHGLWNERYSGGCVTTRRCNVSRVLPRSGPRWDALPSIVEQPMNGEERVSGFHDLRALKVPRFIKSLADLLPTPGPSPWSVLEGGQPSNEVWEAWGIKPPQR